MLDFSILLVYNVAGGTKKMNYGKILANLRKAKKYNQHQVADYMNRNSKKKYTQTMVSHWETGFTSPSVEQFLLLCELYGVSDIQKTFRGIDTEIPRYNKLNELGKNRVDEYITTLSYDPSFINHDSIVPAPVYRKMKLFDIPAAAGMGEFLDNVSYDEIEVDESVPENADFAIRVSGDSMEPRFIDRQIIYIKRQETLNIGDFGIFVLNGDSFIKKLGQRELISLNPNYDPIPVKEFDSFHVFGKVVGW